MPNGRKKTRRKFPVKSAGSPLAKSLREARNLIQAGRQSEGLARLAQLADSVQNPSKRGKIALMVATSEFGLSRHDKAAAAFSRAAQLGRQARDMTLVLQGNIGEIRSLLRSLRVEEAKSAAATLLAELDQSQKEFDAISTLTPAQLARQREVIVPARPPRPGVALTKIATAFIESGFTVEAKNYLEKAVILSPNGASRARQILAKLALASDDPAQAERYARESLQTGRFQAKTVAAWPLYLDARARQNLHPILEPILLEALLTHANGRILSASGISIVRCLRAHGDPVWKDVAAALLTRPQNGDSVILTEIEKTLHADAKLTLSEPPLKLATRALRLFRAADVSSREQIAHGKEYVRYSFDAGRTPDIAAITRLAEKRFGNEHANAVRHTAALAAMLARKHDIARDWLQSLLSDLSPTLDAWGKATWALARMESLLKRFSEASAGYFSLAENLLMPPRFRIQSLLLGLKYLSESGGSGDIPTISNSVRTILNITEDYRVALDAARQLSLAGPNFSSLKKEAAKRGADLADQVIAISSPREALVILEYLARKQYWDADDTEGVLSRWTALSAIARKEFQAIGGSLWFDYLALVFRSMISKKQIAEATALAANVINGDNATPEGYVIVGIEYADWLHNEGDLVQALQYYQWIAKELPTHRKAARAHYALALAARKTGDIQQVKMSAQAVRRCFAGRPSLLDEWEVDCKASLLLKEAGETPNMDLYDPKFVTLQESNLNSDIQ